VEFSAEDATRSDPDFLCEVLESVIEAGATTINIPDTVGYTVPGEFAGLITRIRERVRNIEQVVISAHCHDDLGLSTANSLAAISAGARQVECTVNGIGERAGNTSLEELVMILRVRADRCPFYTAVISEQLFPASQLLTEMTGARVQPNKAIVGRNAFAHEAGIHQDGMIKNCRTYEIMTPESVGVPGTRLVLGKHSGRHALGLRCEQLGFQLDRRELDAVYRNFLVLADRSKSVDDRQILELVRNGRSLPTGSPSSPSSGAMSGDSGTEPLATQFPLAYLAKGGPGHADRILTGLVRDHDGEQQEDYLWGV
jgi:2-isopropylmalate synthase